MPLLFYKYWTLNSALDILEWEKVGKRIIRNRSLQKILNMYAFATLFILLKGFPGGSGGRESACNAGDPGSILGLRRSPGERNCKPTQYSCLENPMDWGAWCATVHGVAKSQTGLSSSFSFIVLKYFSVC